MATGAPGTNGVWLYGEDDSETTFSALLNKAGTTVNTQLGADRTRLTALEAKPLSGIIPVVPSSVTIATGSGSANSLGQVTFTGAASVTLNDVFSSTYKSYKIVFSSIAPSTSGTTINARMCLSGTTDTTNYDHHGGRQFGTNAISGYNAVVANTWDLGNYAGTSLVMDIQNPAIAATTTAQVISTQYVAGVGYGAAFSGLTHAVSTAYDGIRFYAASGTFNGTVQVFGYND